jgi:hypothetical protein
MHGDRSPKTNYYSIIKHSTPESYRKKPCGVPKKGMQFPTLETWVPNKNKILFISPKLPQIDTTDTRMLVRYTNSDWPVTDDLGRQAKEFPPTASHYRPCRQDRSHSTSSGWRQPCQTASPKCVPNTLTNTPTSRPTRYPLANQLVAQGSDLTCLTETVRPTFDSRLSARECPLN